MLFLLAKTVLWRDWDWKGQKLPSSIQALRQNLFGNVTIVCFRSFVLSRGRWKIVILKKWERFGAAREEEFVERCPANHSSNFFNSKERDQCNKEDCSQRQESL